MSSNGANTTKVAFAAALADFGNRTPGENGTLEHSLDTLSKVQDIFVGLNGFTTHSLGSDARIKSLLADLKSKLNVPSVRSSVFVLMVRFLAHVRDCRKQGLGKGERLPTWVIFGWLWDTYSDKSEFLQIVFRNLYSKYGSIGDLTKMYRMIDTTVSDQRRQKTLREFIVSEWASLLSPLKEDETPKDLACKWAPREKSQDSAFAKKIAMGLYPHVTGAGKRLRLYRKLLTGANKKLETVEIKMCDSKFAEIEHAKIPGRAGLKYRKAFGREENAKGVESEDRKVGKKHYLEFIESLKKPDSKGAKGTSAFITELAKVLMINEARFASGGNYPAMTYDSLPDGKRTEVDLATAMWNDQVKNLTEKAAENGIDLGDFFGNFMCMLDFSGSMTGDPLKLAAAMGTFIAPLQNGPFKNKFLTFESNPRFGDLTGCETPFDQIQKMSTYPWGGSTDFEKAHQLILTALESVKDTMTADELEGVLPKFFLVVSDMQFNMASRGAPFETMHETLTEMYAEAGERMIGRPFKLPTMIYWNARGDTNGMPVTSTTEGAMFVSGFSTSVLKTFLTSGVDELVSMTPWSYLEKTINDTFYDHILTGTELEVVDVVVDDALPVVPAGASGGEAIVAAGGAGGP